MSVILLCYRQKGTVLRALESLLTQDVPFSYEVVVADDGSDDGTREVIEEFVSEYAGPVCIRVLPPQPNRGLVRNYFGALRECRGRYITDCAGDDHWIGDSRLREAVRILDANPDVNVVYTDFIIRNGSTDTRAYSLPKYERWSYPTNPPPYPVHFRSPARISGSQLLEGLINRQGALPYLLSAAVFRRDTVLKALATNEPMVCNPEFGCEDLPIMLALASRGDAIFLPEVTMVYNEGGESISNSRHASKTGAFYLKSMLATRTLANFYGKDLQHLTEWYRVRSRYLASLAFRAREAELARGVADELRRWPQQPDLKTRIYLILARLFSR